MDTGELRVGWYVIFDGEPCKIVDITKSKPGKHGSAKARIVAIGIFDGIKRSVVRPVDAQSEVPITEKRSGQVISMLPNAVQLMDLETYEVFEAPKPEESELMEKLNSGAEVEYWQILGRIKIVRVK